MEEDAEEEDGARKGNKGEGERTASWDREDENDKEGKEEGDERPEADGGDEEERDGDLGNSLKSESHCCCCGDSGK